MILVLIITSAITIFVFLTTIGILWFRKPSKEMILIFSGMISLYSFVCSFLAILSMQMKGIWLPLIYCFFSAIVGVVLVFSALEFCTKSEK